MHHQQILKQLPIQTKKEEKKLTTKQDIITIGKITYDYFRKNKTYPKSLKVKGTDYTIQEATYLMASFISNPQPNINKIKVGGASNPNGDRVNRRVIKSVYQDMSKRLTQYIKQTGKLPNYITIDGKQKCSIILFILQLSKILNAYTGSFPSAILINSDDLKKPTPKTECKNPYKATPYNINYGCDNMGQNTGYYCACSMLQKMLYKLGIKVNQSTLASVMGTTTAGTSHQGIDTAIEWVSRKYNVKLKREWKNFSEVGWKGMGEQMCKPNTAVGNHIEYRNTYGHYEYPITINTTNKTIEVINSLGNQCGGGCYCGYIETRSFSEHQSYLNGISQKSVLILTKE